MLLLLRQPSLEHLILLYQHPSQLAHSHLSVSCIVATSKVNIFECCVAVRADIRMVATSWSHITQNYLRDRWPVEGNAWLAHNAAPGGFVQEVRNTPIQKIKRWNRPGLLQSTVVPALVIPSDCSHNLCEYS